MGVVILTKPIQAYGEAVKQLTFREPNGDDIAACGFPMKFEQTDDGGLIFHPLANVVRAYVARLAEIPKGSAGQLGAEDFMACMGEVLSFFGQTPPGMAASPRPSLNDTSTSPGSGESLPLNS